MNSEQARCLITAVAEYIRSQQASLSPLSRPLDEQTRHALSAYFPFEDLLKVRVIDCSNRRLQNPVFFAQLRSMGFEALPDFSATAAITFNNVIALHEPPSQKLICHEMVHVAQFRMLGVDEFVRLYVQGFLTTGSYDDIPLEVCASAIADRIEFDGRPFKVETELIRWLR